MSKVCLKSQTTPIALSVVYGLGIWIYAWRHYALSSDATWVLFAFPALIWLGQAYRGSSASEERPSNISLLVGGLLGFLGVLFGWVTL